MNYRYNEEEYAKLIYEKGFQTRFIKYELVLLVKYLKLLKYSKSQTEEFLYNFCKRHIEGFNKIKYFKIIDSAIRDGRKIDNKLITLKSIDILKHELEYIDSLPLEHEYKKLLLTFLVNKKISMEIYRIKHEKEKNVHLSMYFEGNKKKFNEIFKQANLNSKNNINLMINKLTEFEDEKGEKEIIEPIIRGDIVLKFIEKIDYKNNKEVYYELPSNGFDNVGWVFDYYKGVNNIKKCESCSVLIKQSNNKVKYCKECAREILQEQKNKWKRENWNKYKEEK